jgi:quinoprotein glucose dehydrogenase
MVKPLLALIGIAIFSIQGLQAQSSKTQDWPSYGGDPGGQRYSAERQINAHNVSQLQPVWTFHTHALDTPSPINTRAFFEATPVLWNGLLFFDSPFNQVFALDASTGKLKWTFNPQVPRSSKIYIVAARGVVLWHAASPHPGPCGTDRVLFATLDRRLIARDASTGAACPSFGNNSQIDLAQGVALSDPNLYSFTSPPAIVGDTLILGSSVADNQRIFAASGAVRGFDVLTGRQKWSWEPVRWTANQSPKQTGSGNAWSILSVDVAHDLVFVPTGSPSVDFYGGRRLGDNRDANSIVALRASTGQRVWAFQLVHHDLWDYDVPSQPVLFTFRKTIPAVAVTTKQDMVFVFNRLTGEPLYPIVERPVPASTVPGEQTWPTQPFSTLPSLGPLTLTAADLHLHNPADQSFCTQWLKRLDNHGLFTPPSTNGSLESPGNTGGANWGSSAFDPTTSMLYTRVNSLPYIVQLIPSGQGFGSLQSRLMRRMGRVFPGILPKPIPTLTDRFPTPDHGGNQRDNDSMAGSPFSVTRQALVASDGTPCGIPPYGSIVALNLNTGEKSWTVPNGIMVKDETGSVGTGGVIATAGHLLFAASTFDPHLHAYDSSTGKELWQGDLPVSANATPMTYIIHGRQYIIIAAGGNKTLSTGQGDEIVAFALPAPSKALNHRKK